MLHGWRAPGQLLALALLVTLPGCRPVGLAPNGASGEPAAGEKTTRADLGDHVEARRFLADPNAGVWTEDIPVAQLRQLIDSLYAAGAPEVVFADIADLEGKKVSATLAARLPAQPAPRAKVLTAWNHVYAQTGEDAEKDEGQEWLVMTLD